MCRFSCVCLFLSLKCESGLFRGFFFLENAMSVNVAIVGRYRCGGLKFLTVLAERNFRSTTL